MEEREEREREEVRDDATTIQHEKKRPSINTWQT